MTRINLPKKATEDCPNCGATHLLPVEEDEDGRYVQIDLTPCQHDECTKKLCSACPQFKCAICTLKFCAEHGTKIADDTLCPVCIEIVRAEAISAHARYKCFPSRC